MANQADSRGFEDTAFETDLSGVNLYEQVVDEKRLFSALESLYGEEPFTSHDIERNLIGTAPSVWGTLGSLIRKDAFEKVENHTYQLTEYGQELAQAYDSEAHLQSMATPDGYDPRQDITYATSTLDRPEGGTLQWERIGSVDVREITE